jgi:CheY-like chemotaxis protein
MMGAELHVESVLDQGSTFWFELTLPEGEDQIIPSKESSQQIIGIKGAPCKILLVDDNAENLRLLRDALLPLGFELAEAVNGRDALEKVREFHPDVILVDLIMPEMDGFEVTRQLRQHPLSRDTVVIAISASAFDHTRQKSLAAGCNDFLVKPVRIDQLLVRLQKYLKLEWVYRHDTLTIHDSSSLSGQHLVPPPEKDLSVLLDWIKKGNLMAIAPHLDLIEQLDQKYLPFVAKIRQLAHEFRMDELEELISGFLEIQQSNVSIKQGEEL